MDPSFMEPMFDARPDFFGLPGWPVVLLVAAVGLGVGFWLLRRMVSVDDEYRSFRATDRGRSRSSVASALRVSAGAVGLAVAFASASVLLSVVLDLFL